MSETARVICRCGYRYETDAPGILTWAPGIQLEMAGDYAVEACPMCTKTEAGIPNPTFGLSIGSDGRAFFVKGGEEG